MGKPAAKKPAPAPPPKREPTPMELYRRECAAVAEDDGRWTKGANMGECPHCEAFTRWLDPDGKTCCPGCWDWSADADAEVVPMTPRPKPLSRLPKGVSHPRCAAHPAVKVPDYEWHWNTRKKARKLVLTACCKTCGRPCGEVDQKVFAPFAPEKPPAEATTGALAFETDALVSDPDDEPGLDAWDVVGKREKEKKRKREPEKQAVPIPFAMAACASCWVALRGRVHSDWGRYHPASVHPSFLNDVFCLDGVAHCAGCVVLRAMTKTSSLESRTDLDAEIASASAAVEARRAANLDNLDDAGRVWGVADEAGNPIKPADFEKFLRGFDA